ncbi:MAG: hypothetical protein FJ029_00940 [Actinobacteria bacterium]|nr:hypothetical protein [Actinomycetota bacterium]
MVERDGDVHAVKVSRYLQPVAASGIAILGQPVEQPYFHRPLQALFGPAFEAGFVLNGLAEPAFAEMDGRDAPPGPWNRFHEIPPVLVTRLLRPS